MVLVATQDRELAARPSEKTDNYLRGNLELVIAPSEEPESILSLHSWMERLGEATLTNVSGSFHKGTVLTVYVANPTRFLASLAELFLVDSLAEQQSAIEETNARDENELGEAEWNLGPTVELRRFRVMLAPMPSGPPDSFRKAPLSRKLWSLAGLDTNSCAALRSSAATISAARGKPSSASRLNPYVSDHRPVREKNVFVNNLTASVIGKPPSNWCLSNVRVQRRRLSDSGRRPLQPVLATCLRSSRARAIA